MAKSNLDLLNLCDNFPYYQSDPELYLASISTYYQFQVPGHDYPIGYVLPSVAEIFRGLQSWEIDDEIRTLTLVDGSNLAERSEIVEKTGLAMRATGHFKVLEKWRDELYNVYGKNKEVLFTVERSVSALLGVVTYGIHTTAYTKKDGEYKIWVPRRAKTKHTFPGMLDNAVAGGIAAGENPFVSLIRECEEEASLSEDLVRKHAKSAGTISYFYIRDERAGGETRLLQPEVQYVFDIELPEDITPKPNDDEVEEFYLLGVDEVKAALSKDEFKPNCGLVIIDFFIRHGILTPDNEKDYVEIVSRLHRKFEFPTL